MPRSKTRTARRAVQRKPAWRPPSIVGLFAPKEKEPSPGEEMLRVTNRRLKKMRAEENFRNMNKEIHRRGTKAEAKARKERARTD